MGKKSRRERVEKRESFAAKHTKTKRKNTLVTIGVFALIGIVVTYAAFEFAYNTNSLPGSPVGAGPLGGEHEHASILTLIHADTFNFTGTAYQIQNNWIHFENQDGTTIHRHAANVTLGYLFESLNIGLTNECFTFPDATRSFCTDERYSLKFYINGDQIPDIVDYVIQDDDRVLISYGEESEDAIFEQIDMLNDQPILS